MAIKKILQYALFGFLIALAISILMPIGYYLYSIVFPEFKIIFSDNASETFLFIFGICAIVYGALGILIGGLIGYFKTRNNKR